MTAVARELIDGRVLDLIREREVLDARIAELEQIREQLPADDAPAGGDEPEVPAAPEPVPRPRKAWAVAPGPSPPPSANGTGGPPADPLSSIARALADAGGPAGSTQAVADLAGVSYPTASKYLRMHGPDAPGRSQCFKKGEAGWELTTHGRDTLLKDG